MDRNALIAAMRETASGKPVPVDVPGWPQVFVRPLTVGEVNEQQDVEGRGLAHAAAGVFCDDAGKRIFDASKAEDVELIAQQPWPLLQRILDVANKGHDGKN